MSDAQDTTDARAGAKSDREPEGFEDQRKAALAALGLGLLRLDERGVVLWMDAQARSLLEHALVLVPKPGGGSEKRLLTTGGGGKFPWEVVLQRGKAAGLAFEVRNAEGRLTPVVFDGACERDADGSAQIVMSVRRHEESPGTEDTYRALFESVNDGVVVHDIETGAIVEHNRKAMELFRYKEGEAPPRAAHESTSRPANDADAEAFARMLKAASGEPQVFEWQAVDREGREMILEVSLKRARLAGVDRLVAVSRDITERKRTEQELVASQERYRAIIEASHDIIWVLDAQANFIFVNKRGEELTGHKLEEWKGKSFAPVVYSEDLPKAQDAFVRTMQGERVRYEVRVVDARGQVRQLQANLEPLREGGEIVGMVGLGTDITERTRLEDELHKAQKLESLGLLAGGIAHDFNNILTAVVGGITLARRSVNRPEVQAETLEVAEKACVRARELTQQLLTFSRGGAPVRRPGSIAELLRETAGFALRGSNVRCDLSLQQELHLVEMDAGQMSQVVNNLLLNAAQAMPDGGTVGLRADNFEMVEEDSQLPTLRPGWYVRISVHDQGPGIPQEHLPNIFDPYFTTKPAGTGLGLATSYSIVRRHDGYIDVESEPGRGTTFHIYLPSTTKTRAPSEEPPVPESKRGGKILMMDDDAMVREVGAEMLRVLGFDVVVTHDGRRAIEAYREALEAGHRFDAVILDLTVPGGMGGRETAGILRRLDPDARLIASSGYSTDPVMADHGRYGFDGVVAKPYVPEDLDRAMGMVFRAR